MIPRSCVEVGVGRGIVTGEEFGERLGVEGDV